MPRWIICTKLGTTAFFHADMDGAIWHYAITHHLVPMRSAGELLAWTTENDSWLIITDVERASSGVWRPDGSTVHRPIH